MSVRKNPSMLSEVVLEVGSENGSLTLLRERRTGEGWQFWIETDETTLYDLLSDEDRDAVSEYSAQTGYVPSFEEALNLLDRYPWIRLSPIEVHPEFLDTLLLEVKRRGDKADETRWQERLMHRNELQGQAGEI